MKQCVFHRNCIIKCLNYVVLQFGNIQQLMHHLRCKIVQIVWNHKLKNLQLKFKSHHIKEQLQTVTGTVNGQFDNSIKLNSDEMNFVFRNPLSRQSTNESNDSDTTPTQSYMTSTVTSSATIGSDKQPIKKSPREFIIPISVEGGGVVTPRANSIEQSESNLTQSSSMSGKRISRPRRISSIFKEDSEEESPVFPKLNRHTSIGRESDSEEPRFHSMHRLR